MSRFGRQQTERKERKPVGGGGGGGGTGQGGRGSSHWGVGVGGYNEQLSAWEQSEYRKLGRRRRHSHW